MAVTTVRATSVAIRSKALACWSMKVAGATAVPPADVRSYLR